MAESSEVLNRAFCNRFSNNCSPLTDHLKQSVNKVKIGHVRSF